MAANYPYARVGEVAENLDRYRIPLSSRERSERQGSYPYYGATGVLGYVDDYLFDLPATLIGEDGSVETESGYGLVQYVTGRYWVSNHAHVLRGIDPEDTRYLYYALAATKVSPYITGSVQAKLSQSNLNRIEIPYPNGKVRRHIGNILALFDDKIESNKHQNRILERAGQTLFKSWFIDFDPVVYNAVHAGNPIPEQFAETAARYRENRDTRPISPELARKFPDEFEASGGADHPRGWKPCTLDEIVEVNPRRELSKGAVAPYLDMKNMPTDGMSPADWGERERKSGCAFTNGDTLLARITPCLENGKTAFVNFLQAGEMGWGSTEYLVLRSRSSLPNEFTYFLARNSSFREYAVANMTGSSGRQRVPASMIQKYPFIRADEEVYDEFHRQVGSMADRIELLAVESRTLRHMRDMLLPKLISGELRVPDAEDMPAASHGSLAEA